VRSNSLFTSPSRKTIIVRGKECWSAANYGHPEGEAAMPALGGEGGDCSRTRRMEKNLRTLDRSVVGKIASELAGGDSTLGIRLAFSGEIFWGGNSKTLGTLEWVHLVLD